ncbi:MAG TPA: PAS domain-containing protein, partial [Sulfitobacter sp.]|nr:PAS domain-containing protein [Sulfitobacter sp.]
MKHLPPLDDMPQTGSRRVMPPPTPAMVDVRAYWQGLCRGQPVPFRSQIDPAQITSVLDRAFVLERRRSELARFRVAGSQLCTAMGMDLRGMPMIS